MPDDTRRDAIEIRPAERQLLVGGKPAALGARAFDLLLALYERRDRVVTKNELLDVVWPGLVVEENNLQVQVSGLRKLLGPSAIATIPGRGYRFTLPDEVMATSRRAAQAAASLPGVAEAAADEPPRGNLPASPPMVGRDDDLAVVAALLDRHPVVSIVGAGGIGKTRLALAVAQASSLDTPDGRWWVELAPLADASQVPATVAATLGVQLAGNRRSVDALGAVLSKHRALVVLDNCEHVADAVADVVASLRAQAPGVRVLVTSQELLKCVDEQAFRLASLALPATDDLDTASRCRAVALFIARARRRPALCTGRRQRGRGDRHLPPARRHSAGDRAGRRARADARRAGPACTPRSDVQRADRRRTDAAAPPPDAACRARTELRPADRGRTRGVPPARRVCRRIHARLGAGGGVQ
jgi:DNA-binding winged helix-turn-helix (wHTH) protein